jgi:type II secretory pathway pseudopilin PulG
VRTVDRIRAARRRDERGFGLVELLIAMTMLLIGILALFAMFQTGILQIRRASTVSTASALAEAEIENYRAIKYDSIGLATADITPIPSTDPYKTDSAYIPGSLVTLPKCPGGPPCTSSLPTQTKTAADGRSYRVDTFMSWQAVANGRNVKLITIVVRDAASTSKVWARVMSSFDQSTGL